MPVKYSVRPADEGYWSVCNDVDGTEFATGYTGLEEANQICDAMNGLMSEWPEVKDNV